MDLDRRSLSSLVQSDFPLSWTQDCGVDVVVSSRLGVINKKKTEKQIDLLARYEFYHDAIRGGQYIWEVEKMHRRYVGIFSSNL